MKKLIFPLLLIAIVGAFAFGAKDANAVSTYDGLIQTTSTLTVKHGSAEENVTYTAVGAMIDCSKWTSRASAYGISCSTFNDDFDVLMEQTYGWTNNERTLNTSLSLGDFNGTTGDKFVTFTYNKSTNAHGEFVTYGSDKFLMMRGSTSSTCTINLSIDDNSTDEGSGTTDGLFVTNSFCESGTGYSEPVSMVDGTYYWNSRMYFFNAPITYPSDYEGTIPPDTGEEPRVHSDLVPNLQLLNVVDFKGTFSDANFATYDDVPFLCAGDLAPALHYEIYREGETEVLLTSGVMSATGQLEFQFTRSDQNLDYRIVGYYDCGDTSGDPIFDNSSYADFTINRGGLIESNIFEECMNADFPFIHFDDCIANLYTVINLISFNTIGFNNSWNSAEGCYDLVVLDDWMHLDDPTVCPQVPSFVRSVVTPFVTLGLGLVTITFLARNRGSNW